MADSRETVLLDTTEGSHMNSLRLWRHTHGLPGFEPDRAPALKAGSGHSSQDGTMALVRRVFLFS